MATVMKKVDAVIVGFGWTGAIMAKELTEAGLNVLALERGPMQDTYPDGDYPQVIDELTYSVRKKLFQDISKETVTIRHSVNDVALPNRQLGAFLPGNGVGGAGLHWSGVHFRVDPIELRMRSHYEERYGKNFIPKDMTIQDFGVSYEELEPFFDFAEKVFGTSGQAWTVKGQLVGQGKGGNPYAPDRSNPFPLESQKNTVFRTAVQKAAHEVGYKPYNLPSANTSGPYTNPYGAQMGPCNFCGFCSGYVCYMYSKASPNVNILPALKPVPNFRAARQRPRAAGQSRQQQEQGHRRDLHRCSGPRDRAAGGSGDPRRVPVAQRASDAAVGHRQALRPEHRRRRGRANFAYQNMATIKAFFDKDVHTNNFIGAGGNGVAMDDFNADNFDHGPHGFVGGSPMWVNQAGSRPIAGTSNPPGTPAWGSAWKRATAEYYTHQVSMDAHGAHQSYRGNYLDLDPVYRDAYGLPLLRMTFDWQENDIKMNRFMVEKMGKIAEAMSPKAIAVIGKKVGEHFNTASYQTTHLNGGAIMGTDPKTSALNRYLQSWDVHNVFVPGASAFPQGLGYNPTGLVAALTYWSAKAIREQYLKNPGPLVQA